MAGVFKTLGSVSPQGIDVKRRAVPFVVTDGVDEHGTRVPPENLHLDRFRGNPVFLWMHRSQDNEVHQVSPDDVIGHVPQIEVIGGHLVFEAVFSKHDLAERCFQAILDRRLNAVSISFKPVATHPEGGVIVVDEAELFEISLVIIGSNPEALALRQFIEADMNPDILKKLGLADGAGPGDILVALAQYLARSEDDKVLVEEVLKALPNHGSPAENAEAGAGNAQRTAGTAEGDGQQAQQGQSEKRELFEEVKRLATRMDEMEKRALPQSVAAAVHAELAKLRVNETAAARQNRSLTLGGPSTLPKPAAAAEAPAAKAAAGILARSQAHLSANRLATQ